MTRKENIRSEVEWGSLAPTGLPAEVRFCSKCIVSNQKPTTTLECKHTKNDWKNTIKFTNDVCDACRWAELKNNEIDWGQREEELARLCDTHRSNRGAYDVVVPASGGKDSRYVAHLLKHKYNMTPLTVTWKPHEFTQVGFQNLMGLIENGNPNIMVSPPGDTQRKLTRLAFRNLGHPFQPFIVGQRVVAPKVALSNGIKLVFYGENVAEYGNNIRDNFSPLMDPELYTCFDFNENTLDDYLLGGVSLKQLILDYDFKFKELHEYKSPSLKDIDQSNIEVHYMSYYKKWVPQENFYYAVKHTNFKPNDKRKDGSYSKYAGIDDTMEDLHFFMQAIKFGMGRCTWDAAQEIRTGKLERDEAVALVRKYDLEPPKENLPSILKYLNVDESEFWSIVDSFRPKHLWKRTDDGSFELRKVVASLP